MLEDDHSKECGNFIAKKYWKEYSAGVIFYFYTPIRKSENFTPAGNIWVSGYVHHRLKRGHPGHNNYFFIYHA